MEIERMIVKYSILNADINLLETERLVINVIDYEFCTIKNAFIGEKIVRISEILYDNHLMKFVRNPIYEYDFELKKHYLISKTSKENINKILKNGVLIDEIKTLDCLNV